MLDHMYSWIYFFEESLYCFLWWLHRFTSQQCTTMSFSPRSWQYVIYRIFDDNHVTGMRWYLTAVWISFSVIISNVEHLYHAPVCYLYVFFRNMPIQVFSPFLIGLFRVLGFFVSVFFSGHWVVWVVCVVWVLTSWQSYHLQIFPSTPKVVFAFCQWLPFLYKSFWI